ncbi:MAG TPA: carbohydrate binding domain-containing protein [Terriglobales bacterium]|jgi:tetratricopeptide (TPR) repeat protein
MQIPLHTPARKYLFLIACGLVVALYITLSAASFLSQSFSRKTDSQSLAWAVRLSPGNAEAQSLMGNYYLLSEHSPDRALEYFRTATALNPYKSRYWLELAHARQALDKPDEQATAIEHALAMAPRTPSVAWEAGNLYTIAGDRPRALAQFREVLQGAPTMAARTIPMAWRVSPNVDTFLNDLLPPNPEVYYALLDFLMARKETASVGRAWDQLAELRQPLRKERIFELIRFLLRQQDVEKARMAWKQAAALCDLQPYQPTSDNLIVNGDFDHAVLNAGFDWTFTRSKDVTLAIDPVQTHSSHRSLLITFDALKLYEAGIHQLIPVTPETTYDFSAFFKTEALEGAGGPRFALMDAYDSSLAFASGDLSSSDSWKEVRGSFTTGPSTKLLALMVQRVPRESAIRGKLWITGLRLRQKD